MLSGPVELDSPRSCHLGSVMLDSQIELKEPSSSGCWNSWHSRAVLVGPSMLGVVDSQNETILPVCFYENPVNIAVKRCACWLDGVGSHWTVLCGPAGQHFHWLFTLYRCWALAGELYCFKGGTDCVEVVTEEVPAEERAREGGDKEMMSLELVAELHHADNGTVDLDILSIDSKHVAWVVSLGVEVGEFVVVEQGAWEAACDGAGVDKKPWLVWVVKVAHVRLLQNCQGGWIVSQFEPPAQWQFA